MKAFETLKREMEGKKKLEDLVSAFEDMCKVPIENIDREDEIIWLETGTFPFPEETLFVFDLMRQFPNQEDDEFIQIHLYIQYKPSEKNRAFRGLIEDYETGGDFFGFVRNSAVYKTLLSEEIYRVMIDMSET